MNLNAIFCYFYKQALILRRTLELSYRSQSSPEVEQKMLKAINS